jgi:pilus assembly protein CpaE
MTMPGAPAAPGAAAPQVAVAVIDADQTARSRLAMQLGPGATPFGSLNELADRLNGQPVVVVLGPTFHSGLDLAEAEQLLSSRRELGAIMVTNQLTTDLLQRALRAGVKDVLQAPLDTGQLVDAITRAASALLPVAPVPAAPGSAFVPADGEVGKVMTVFSTKGGAGKSVVATNLAVLLAKRSDRPVVLIDADLQFGDVAVMLKLAPQHTVVDAVSALDRLDVNMLGNLLIEHKPSSLLVLPAPMEPAFADQIGAAEMVRIVEVLRTFCSYVVIDTPAYFNDVVLGLIEISDDVLLVAGMDIPNIKNVKIGLQTLRLLNTPMEKLRLILNRSNSRVKLDVGEVERTLGVQADGLIPSDVVVPQAVNKGEAVVLSAPRSAVARSMEEIADLFMPTGAPRKRR